MDGDGGVLYEHEGASKLVPKVPNLSKGVRSMLPRGNFENLSLETGILDQFGGAIWKRAGGNCPFWGVPDKTEHLAQLPFEKEIAGD